MAVPVALLLRDRPVAIPLRGDEDVCMRAITAARAWALRSLLGEMRTGEEGK